MLEWVARSRCKNSRLAYYCQNLARLLLPGAVHRAGLRSLAEAAEQAWAGGDTARRLQRIYRYRGRFELGSQGCIPSWRLLRKQRNYAWDLLEHTRALPAGAAYCWRFGDDTREPERPTLVKARRIDESTGHSILFPLNKVRHFVFVADRMPFEAKQNVAVWRGTAHRPWRQEFLARTAHCRGVDIGCTDDRELNRPYRKPYLSIPDQLRAKFVISVEGTDVATNLKWILSSNSLCLMVPPTKETWFLEGDLVPGEHYVPLRADYADLEDQMERYSKDLDAAQRILRNAQAHVARFQDPRLERDLPRWVLLRYLQDSGQLDPEALRTDTKVLLPVRGHYPRRKIRMPSAKAALERH